MMEKRCDGSMRRGRSKSVALSLAIFLPFAGAAGAASAAEVKFPDAKPAVAFDVPDDWKIDTAKGLDMRAPDKKAIIVADIIERDRTKLNAWANAAAEQLKTFGVAFDPKAKAPVKPPGAASLNAPAAPAKNADAPTFSGKPSLAMPGTAGSNNTAKPGPTSLESLTAKGGSPAPSPPPKQKLPLRGVQYYGTTLDGKPVDVQLMVYTLPDKHLFVMMQESGPDDGRTVAIVQSVRSIKAAK